MQKRILRTGLTVLLAIAVLTGALVPPAVQHAHAEGDQAHDHRTATPDRQADHHAHSHGHAHRHAHPHSHDHTQSEASDNVAQETGTQSGSIYEAILHLHLNVFGFELYLPIGERESHSGNGSESYDDDLALVRLVETKIAGSFTVGNRSAIAPNPAKPLLDAGSRLQGSQNMLSSLPLCDTARGERSGVQRT